MVCSGCAKGVQWVCSVCWECVCVCHVCYMCHGCAMGVQWACGAPSEYRAWWECGGGGGVSVTWVARVVGVLWVCNGCAMGVQWVCGALNVCSAWWECVSVCVSRVSWVCNGCAWSGVCAVRGGSVVCLCVTCVTCVTGVQWMCSGRVGC